MVGLVSDSAGSRTKSSSSKAPSTQNYVTRRTQEGLSKKQILCYFEALHRRAALQTPTGSCRYHP